MSTVRVNDKIKKEVTPILDELGISLSEAINMFLHQIKLTNSIPLDLKVNKLNSETIKAIEDVENNIGLSKGYSDLDEMWNDLEEDE